MFFAQWSALLDEDALAAIRSAAAAGVENHRDAPVGADYPSSWIPPAPRPSPNSRGCARWLIEEKLVELGVVRRASAALGVTWPRCRACRRKASGWISWCRPAEAAGSPYFNDASSASRSGSVSPSSASAPGR